MDKVGVATLLAGIVLCAVGGYAIWAFLPDVIVAVKGIVGIAVVCVGLMMVLFGILIVKE